MNEKTDELFLKVNDWLRTLNDKITPNIILLVALVNGFTLGFITTGFLGTSSVPIQSFTFGLFGWQFIVIMFFSAKYVSLTTAYLHKFGMSGIIGFALQWQIFGMWAVKYDEELAKNIEPIMDNGFGTFLFFYFCLLGVKYCFNDNQKSTEIEKQYNV